MAEHNSLGKWGERIAEDYLVSKGYAIADRNWKSGNIEIDLIGFYKNHVVFIEVKTRRVHYDHPEDAVDRRRMARMVRAADAYIRKRNLPHGVQYDIIAVTGDPHEFRVHHIPDAFYPRLRMR